MNDLTPLHEAFAELERRADAEAWAGLTVRPATHVPSSRRRPLLVAATVVTLLAAVGGAVVVANHSDRPTAVAAGGPSTTSSSSDAPSASTSSSTSGLPTSTDELRARFQAVLGDLATFTVTNDASGQPQPSAPGTPGADGSPLSPAGPVSSPSSPAGARDVAIIGVLTAAGVSGGFDVQTLQTDPGTAAWCETDTPCTVTPLSDGASVAIGISPVLAADGSENGGTTYTANYIRADGSEVLLHLSNQRDPKGMSEVLAPQPPLTTDQLTAVVSSPLWQTG